MEKKEQTKNISSGYQKFAPLLSNFYDNKIIYREKMSTYIVTVTDLSIVSDYFKAIATILLPIQEIRFKFKRKCWEFGGNFNYMRKSDNSLTAGYGGWQIWTDPELVKEIERLTIENKIDEVIKLLYG